MCSHKRDVTLRELDSWPPARISVKPDKVTEVYLQDEILEPTGRIISYVVLCGLEEHLDIPGETGIYQLQGQRWCSS